MGTILFLPFGIIATRELIEQSDKDLIKNHVCQRGTSFNKDDYEKIKAFVNTLYTIIE